MKDASRAAVAIQQGWVGDITLLSGKGLWPVLLVLAMGLFGAVAPAPAQSGDDLNVPGLTDGVPAGNAVPVTTATDPGGEAGGSVSRADTSLMGLIAAGGWAMWVLGLFSMALVGLSVYCGMDLRRLNFSPEELKRTLDAEMGNRNLEGAFAAARANPATLGRMIEAVGGQVEETGYSTEDNETLRDQMAEAGMKANRWRAKVINYFSVLAQAAPMMGLLGTVSGMIKAFGTLQRKGMGNPNELAGNISEALVTTAAGLIIALPAIFLYFFFRDRLEELILECEDFGLGFLTKLRRVAYAAAETEAVAPESEAGAVVPEPDFSEEGGE